jgi:hypothetical protein
LGGARGVNMISRALVASMGFAGGTALCICCAVAADLHTAGLDFTSAVTLAAATRMAKMPALDQLLLLIEQNYWQDAALSAGNIFFCFTLIPMFRHPGRPPLLTCIPTALALLAGGFVFATLHLWVTALTQTITGLQWLALAFKKSRQIGSRSPNPRTYRFGDNVVRKWHSTAQANAAGMSTAGGSRH